MASNYMRGEILNVKIKMYTKETGIQIFIDDVEFFVLTDIFHLAKLSNVEELKQKMEKYKKAPKQKRETEKMEIVKYCCDRVLGTGAFKKLFKKYESVEAIDFIVSTAMDQLAIEIEKREENGRWKNRH
jgi:hypothetical protein